MSEKRTGPRLPIEISFHLEWQDGAIAKTFPASAINISRAGLRVRMTSNLPVGDPIRIKSQTIQAEGVVKYCASTGDEEYELGLEITSAGKLAVLSPLEHLSLISSTLFLAEALAEEDMESTRAHVFKCHECKTRLDDVADAVLI